MKKPAVFLAGVGTCALAVASCAPASTTTPAQQSNPGGDSAQSAPGATASPTIAPDAALTSKNLASINEAVAAAFPGASVSVEREYRNALRGYALRVPDGSLDTIRSVSGVQAVYLDGNNHLQ